MAPEIDESKIHSHHQTNANGRVTIIAAVITTAGTIVAAVVAAIIGLYGSSEPPVEQVVPEPNPPSSKVVEPPLITGKPTGETCQEFTRGNSTTLEYKVSPTCE